jgi:hypothetical protein
MVELKLLPEVEVCDRGTEKNAVAGHYEKHDTGHSRICLEKFLN